MSAVHSVEYESVITIRIHRAQFNRSFLTLAIKKIFSFFARQYVNANQTSNTFGVDVTVAAH